MITTLDIDADVLSAAEHLAARSRRTPGQVISELMRRALKSAGPPATVINGFETIPAGERVVTPELVQQLTEQSEGA